MNRNGLRCTSISRRIPFFVVLLCGLVLETHTSSAAEFYLSPRFWYAIENLNAEDTSEILGETTQTHTSIDQDTIPLVGLSFLIESKIDVIGSFFWGTSKSNFISTSRLQASMPVSDIRNTGSIKTTRYDAEILLRWRPKDRFIYLVTGLRYYHLNYDAKSDRSVQVPPIVLPGLPGADTSLRPLPTTSYTNDMILWEIGGGLSASITPDAKHRLIAGALVGFGYSRFTTKRDDGAFFADPTFAPAVTYGEVDESIDRFALIWDVNVGYQWQFHPRMNFVARYRAFGKPGAAADSTNLVFIVSHGPEIGIGYRF